MTIHIEISKSFKPKTYRLRIGDIAGSIEEGLMTKKEVLKDIEEEIDRIK